MAQGQASAVDAPDVLPADFFDKKAPQGAAPDTLPGDFFDKQPPTQQSNAPAPTIGSRLRDAAELGLKTIPGLQAVADPDIWKGIGEGLLQDTASTGRLIQKIPGIGPRLIPEEGLRAERGLATPVNSGQRLGAGLEQAAEMALPTGETGLGLKMLVGAGKGAASTAMHEGGTTPGIRPRDVAISAGIGAAAPALESGIRNLASSKLGRSMVNESMGASARDVTYGNPAKGLLDNNIGEATTGDLENYKEALRNGAAPEQAAEAAGGRMAAVSQKINELSPKLEQALSASNARIPAKQTVTDTIDNAIKEISANHGVTQTDAQAAINELNEMKQAALKTSGGGRAIAWSPAEANNVKREIGQQVNWMGKERVGQLVEPVRKQVYGSLKAAINSAVPGSQEINENLTNLLAAQRDLHALSGAEEVGRGSGALRGTMGTSAVGRVMSLAGRGLPLVNKYAPATRAVPVIGIPSLSQRGSE